MSLKDDLKRKLDQLTRWASHIVAHKQPPLPPEEISAQPAEDSAVPPVASRGMSDPQTVSRRQETIETTHRAAPELRTLHLGLDYGTSFSKMVLRDYEAVGGERSHVVYPAGSKDFRVPSLVCSEDGRLWFGLEAADRVERQGVIVYPSIKIRMALPEHLHASAAPLPAGLSADDLACLSVGYLLQEAQRTADGLAARYRTQAKMNFTLGVPMSDLDNPHLRDRFVAVARKARQLTRIGKCPDLRQGISIGDAGDLLRAASESVTRLRPADPREWVRSEVEAALLWPFKSADTGPGLYAAVDVGAGTTSASFFYVTSRRNGPFQVKVGMAFYGTACLPPGGDAIGEVIAGGRGDVLAVRTRENELLDDAKVEKIRTVTDQITKTYRLAFGRSYSKNKSQSAWEGYRLFLTGGGTQIHALRNPLKIRAWLNLHSDPEILDPGPPPDLELGELAESALPFLMVAYGLSYFKADVPSVDMPSDIEPLVLKPPRIIDLDGEPDSFQRHVQGRF